MLSRRTRSFPERVTAWTPVLTSPFLPVINSKVLSSSRFRNLQTSPSTAPLWLFRATQRRCPLTSRGPSWTHL